MEGGILYFNGQVIPVFDSLVVRPKNVRINVHMKNTSLCDHLSVVLNFFVKLINIFFQKCFVYLGQTSYKVKFTSIFHSNRESIYQEFISTHCLTSDDIL